MKHYHVRLTFQIILNSCNYNERLFVHQPNLDSAQMSRKFCHILYVRNLSCHSQYQYHSLFIVEPMFELMPAAWRFFQLVRPGPNAADFYQ